MGEAEELAQARENLRAVTQTAARLIADAESLTPQQVRSMAHLIANKNLSTYYIIEDLQQGRKKNG